MLSEATAATLTSGTVEISVLGLMLSSVVQLIIIFVDDIEAAVQVAYV